MSAIFCDNCIAQQYITGISSDPTSVSWKKKIQMSLVLNLWSAGIDFAPKEKVSWK